VLAVGTFAAVISYSHIYALARAHGQTVLDARLMPLAVDGLILSASLLQLHEARNGRPVPALARWMLWLGIAGTVAANVAYGLPSGPEGSIVSAWPAASFIGSAELLMLLVRSERRIVPDSSPAIEPVPWPVLVPNTVPPLPVPEEPVPVRPAPVLEEHAPVLDVPVPVLSEHAPEHVPVLGVPWPAPAVPVLEERVPAPALADNAVKRYAAALEERRVPSVRQIKTDMHVANVNAKLLRQHLLTVVEA
jgi:Protein of unknown function (DUF2637)